MNKIALKNFATNARKELIEKVKAKAFKIGITEENIKKAQFESSDSLYIDGKQLSATERKQREKLISRIKEIGYYQVVEEVAYTWFNRFTALRFMEVNNYLPTKVRVLSSSNTESPEPDIIKESLTIDLDIDKELVYELRLNNKTEELFKYLVIKQCNSLNKILPFMFETIDDYKEILFPDDLLAKDTFLRKMTDVEVISESDWKQIEIIGWLYQYYISEEKDRVMKAKKKYRTEDIPFATQLFTPNWIVRYMVQNSLGRYWVESHPEHKELIRQWEFYLEGHSDDNNIVDNSCKIDLDVEHIKCFDPAMGSEHILVYMFDVLYEIYRSCGYMERDIPKLIIENNLYGLDIDDRAYQLACFSIVMKAMQYNQRFLSLIEREGLLLNLASIQETNLFDSDDIYFIAGTESGEEFEKTKELIERLKDAKTYGSLLKIRNYDKAFFVKKLDEIRDNPARDILKEGSRSKAINILPNIIKQLEILSNSYDVLITNPPYMGNRYMNDKLSLFLKREYPDSKFDTFASFMEIDHYIKPNGYMSMINQHSWMFISSFEALRKKLLQNKTLLSMLHLGPRAFEEISGEIVQTTAFVVKNSRNQNVLGDYIRLVDFMDTEEKRENALKAIKDCTVDYRYSVSSYVFDDIIGSPIAYWVTDQVRTIFKNGLTLGEVSSPRQGLATGDNERFLRLWFEVNIERIGFNIKNEEDAVQSGKRWFPYNKGGEFRKWYGNNEWVVNWENNGDEIKNNIDESGKQRSRPQNTQYYFKESITWSFISSAGFGVRYSPQGAIFDVGGSSLFVESQNIYYFVGFLCSNIAFEFMKIQNPTLNFQVGNVASLPVCYPKTEYEYEEINRLVQENINISKADWDYKELSWNYITHPFIQFRDGMSTVEEIFSKWKKYTIEQYNTMKSNEKRLNDIYYNIYGLTGELSLKEHDYDITVSLAKETTEIKTFLSYFVGCLMGRYSLDEPGLVYAGGTFNVCNYQTIKVNEDGIIPILQNHYFEYDIVTKFIEFVSFLFGAEKLKENIAYITSYLNPKDNGTATEILRKYFVHDFYQDHISIFSSRGRKAPVYWYFTSGKQKAFNCLIYMHRYDKSTLSRIRTDYLHEVQLRMDSEKKVLLDIIDGDGTTKEIVNAKKELKILDLKIEELRAYDEKLHHMADMQIEIDLDDGVAVNYAKFEGLLAPIK